MIKEKEEDGARPSKINGSINKACCCARAGVPALTWVTGVHGFTVRAWVRASGKSSVVVMGGGWCGWEWGREGWGGHSSTKLKQSSKCTAARGNQKAQANLFGDVRRVWSTLLGLLLLNTSCLLQSVWSCLHYWYNKGGPEGPGLRWCTGPLSLSWVRLQRVCFLWELRGKLGQIWN